LGGEIIDFIRPILVDDVDEGNLVDEIGRNEGDLVLDVFDSFKVDGAGAANGADDFVVLF
jgi:hypothetical protein